MEQESNKEHQETERQLHLEMQEEIGNQKMEHIQEDKLNQQPLHNNGKKISQQSLETTANKMESLLELEEKDILQETSQKSIQEIKQDITQEKEISQEQIQEDEQEFTQETQPILKESDVKERYKRETGKRPIYAGSETKGFIEWKEQFKQHKQEQEQKNISLNEKEKESKEQQEEFREPREEWFEYLAISIKESEFPEEITEKLDHFLDNYEKLRELLKKVKIKEISEEVYEKEVKEFEHILIEERQIVRPLFRNFDWFRRYYKETIRKSGKRVAKLYISKKTREFLSYIARRIEQLKNLGSLHENTDRFEEYLEKSFQIREKWAHLLNSLIHEVPKKEISREVKKELETVIKKYCEIRAILFNNNILKEDKEKLIQGRIDKCNPRFFELFEILKRFLGIYDSYSRNWMEQSLFIEGKKTVKLLSQKLEYIKKENAINQFLSAKRYSVQKFKENLKQNLYKTTELNLKEKSKIIKIIQNENFDERNKVKLTKILSKLSIEELISFLGKNFEFEAFSGFKKIRHIISLYIFELIKDLEIETSEIVLNLRENILKNISLPIELTPEDIDVLLEFASTSQHEFIKYFSDLTEIIKQLNISGKIHKKIGAFLIMNIITEILEEKDINLLQTSESFYRSVIEIFDVLKKNYSNYFPQRMIRIKTENKLSKKEFLKRHYDYMKIVGKKLKIYVIQHIYNGKYFKNGKGRCPECLKEDFITNTDISRLADLEFHHYDREKENNFNEDSLYRLFLKNRSNSDFLKDLIKLMESEGVELLCRNHHSILHDDYYRYFNYLINWEPIFSLHAEQIHILIRISVNSFYEDLKSVKEKEQVRKKIVRKLKKRYIVETLFGEFCLTCKEFNTKKHLPAFQFNHSDEVAKTIEASDLYNINTCSEIVRKLKEEKGGYVCGNCHSVLHYKFIHLLDEIYDNKDMVQRVLEDFKNITQNFKLIQKINSIGNPLKKVLMVRDGIENYLSAIYEISKLKGYANTHDLKDFLQVSNINVIGKFFRNRISTIKRYINIEVGRPHHPSKYTLNTEGKKFVSVMHHFRDYYNSLKQD